MPEIDIHQNIPQINIDTATRTYHLPIASETQLGGIKVGNNLTIEEDGTLNAEATEYDLPVATSSTLGGVKIGSGLIMTDQVLSVNVDSTLNNASTNPVRNSVISSNLNTLTTTVQTMGNTVTSLGNSLSTLSGTVSDHTTSISNLSTTVTNQGNAIDTNTGNISDLSSSYGDLSSTVGGIDTRLGLAEGNITDLQNGANEMASDITDLKYELNTTISYTELLPVSSWVSGSMVLRRRGKVAYLFLNIEGSMVIGANSSTTIYTFTEPTNVPAYGSFAPIYTDTGSIIMTINNTGEVDLLNLAASSVTITKIYGTLPIMY